MHKRTYFYVKTSAVIVEKKKIIGSNTSYLYEIWYMDLPWLYSKGLLLGTCIKMQVCNSTPPMF